MKQTITFCLSLLFSISLFAQSPVGIWKTIDDKDGQAASHIEVYEQDGKFHGKVIKLLQESDDTLCEFCKGDKKNQPIVGMEILWDLKKYKDYWSYGKIMDPENGKVYKCNVELKTNDELTLRGYIGIPALGRSQTWYRIK